MRHFVQIGTAHCPAVEDCSYVILQLGKDPCDHLPCPFLALPDLLHIVPAVRLDAILIIAGRGEVMVVVLGVVGMVMVVGEVVERVVAWGVVVVMARLVGVGVVMVD